MAAFHRPTFWVVLGLIAAVSALPLATGSASLREDLFLILLFVVLASSLNLILGYAGYVSFGHIVFFGLGSYVGFFLVTALGVHLVPAMLAAGAATAAIAFLLGTAVLHLRGAYFAIATIGVNEAMRSLVGNLDFLGGSSGIFLNFTLYQDYGGPAGALTLAYVLMLVLALAVVGASYVVKRSKFGLALQSIRENEDVSLTLGINAQHVKRLAYSLSAVFPAMAGLLFFFKNGNVTPEAAFSLSTSIESIVLVMLGGFGTVLGPVVGAVVYERLRGSLLTSPLFRDLHVVIAGVLLLAIVLFATGGIVGLLRERSRVLREALE
ncbi:MAG: branched-chain amino acid ABC transporter permease [Chloroflexi bacterium]|nr:branched-chain amino acid ABC transporter permease [Chloroflexota bacterium]